MHLGLKTLEAFLATNRDAPALVLAIPIWFVRRYLKRKQELEGGEQHVGSVTFGLFVFPTID